MPTLTVSMAGSGGKVYSVTGSVADGIIDCPSQCSAQYPLGAAVWLGPAFDGGTRFLGWGGACSGVGDCHLTMDADQSVTATFSFVTSSVTVSLVGDGTGTVTDPPYALSCSSGSTQGCSESFSGVGVVLLTAKADPGSTFGGWNAHCDQPATTKGPCLIQLGDGGDHEVTASFTKWTPARWPFPGELTGIASLGGSLFVTGRTSAGGLQSPDGVEWRPDGRLAFNDILSIAGRLHAVDGCGRLHASADGGAWTRYQVLPLDPERPDCSTATLSGLAFDGKDTVVVVGRSIAVFSLTTMQSQLIRSGTNLSVVIYGGGQFVAAGNDGILTSPDGLAWTLRVGGGGSPIGWFTGAAFAQGHYVVEGYGGVFTSNDGVSWTPQAGFPAPNPTNLAASDSNFLLLSRSAQGTQLTAFTSPDGIAWTAHSTALPLDGARVAYLAGAFYSLGFAGDIWRSLDGETWTPLLAREPLDIYQGPGRSAILYDGSQYISGGLWGGIWTSEDGANWVAVHTGDCCGTLVSLAWGPDLPVPMHVAAGNSDTGWYILGSGDGARWTPRATDSSGQLSAVAFGGPAKGFLATGFDTGTGAFVATSSDGVKWSVCDLPSLSKPFSSVAYGNGLFVATGFGVYISPDGESWTRQAAPNEQQLGPIVYGNDTFVALDLTEPGVVTSPDGLTWTFNSVAAPIRTAIAFGNGVFLDSSLATSLDGIHWSSGVGPTPALSSRAGSVFTGAAFGSSGWIATGPVADLLVHP